MEEGQKKIKTQREHQADDIGKQLATVSLSSWTGSRQRPLAVTFPANKRPDRLSSSLCRLPAASLR